VFVFLRWVVAGVEEVAADVQAQQGKSLVEFRSLFSLLLFCSSSVHSRSTAVVQVQVGLGVCYSRCSN